jgi:hypothetical protein
LFWQERRAKDAKWAKNFPATDETLRVVGSLLTSQFPNGLLTTFCSFRLGYGGCFHGFLGHVFHQCHAGSIYFCRWQGAVLPDKGDDGCGRS